MKYTESKEDIGTVAQRLGRTIEACRSRRYALQIASKFKTEDIKPLDDSQI